MTTEDLAAMLDQASTKYELSDALSAIGRHETRVALGAQVTVHLGDRRWLVRHSAIDALANCSDVDVEGILLEFVASSTDPHDILYTNVALGSRGGERSLEYLAGKTTHAKEDVANSALSAMTRIGSTEQLGCFVAALGDRRWAVKWYAMIAIEEHGDATAVEPVLLRVKKILGRERSAQTGGRSELTAGLAFLWRYRHEDAAVTKFFESYLPARRHRLQPGEEAELERLESRNEPAPRSDTAGA